MKFALLLRNGRIFSVLYEYVVKNNLLYESNIIEWCFLYMHSTIREFPYRNIVISETSKLIQDAFKLKYIDLLVLISSRTGSHRIITSISGYSPVFSADILSIIVQGLQLNSILSMCRVCKIWLYNVSKSVTNLKLGNEFKLVSLPNRYAIFYIVLRLFRFPRISTVTAPIIDLNSLSSWADTLTHITSTSEIKTFGEKCFPNVVYLKLATRQADLSPLTNLFPNVFLK
jgi:hypothetical protein